MSNRLNKDREKKLQPTRMQYAAEELRKLGYAYTNDDTKIVFQYRGELVQFFPYSGWHTGKSIKDGRGWDHLYQQLLK